jgi:hypothetical protein
MFEAVWLCAPERMSRVCLAMVILGALLSGAVGQGGEARKLAGRVSLSIDSTIPPGGSFEATWNKGTLTLTDGTVRVFSVSGLGIQGNEGSLVDLEARGEVYQLQRLENFTGTYRRTIGELSPDRDTNTMIIANQHGVVVVLTVSVDRAKGDIRLIPSQSGVMVTLEH